MQNSDSSSKQKPLNITLIGMAGVGKSVIGRMLAELLQYEFIDIDERIENKFGLRLQEVLDRLGEQRFLEIEAQTILELGPLNHAVISPGGSAIYSTRAMTFLKQKSVVIFLDAPFETIEKQISNVDSRGIVWGKKKDLKLLFQERKPLYKKYADLTVKMSEGGNVDTAVREILQKTGSLR
jgi:shikimate kinase